MLCVYFWSVFTFLSLCLRLCPFSDWTSVKRRGRRWGTAWPLTPKAPWLMEVRRLHTPTHTEVSDACIQARRCVCVGGCCQITGPVGPYHAADWLWHRCSEAWCVCLCPGGQSKGNVLVDSWWISCVVLKTPNCIIWAIWKKVWCLFNMFDQSSFRQFLHHFFSIDCSPNCTVWTNESCDLTCFSSYWYI